jgi:hypothetical protein
MPLLDHFNPPLTRTHGWRSFHSAWGNKIADHLNDGVLPPGYYALPNVDLDTPMEIDVAALHDRLASEGADPGKGLALWTPPEPALTAAVDLPTVDTVAVQVLYDEGEPRLIAAIELVSPSNKDRPAERLAFATRCVNHLYRRRFVVIIDPVTTRRANLHAEIWRLLELDGGAPWHSPTDLYAIAYRAAGEKGQTQLQTWAEPLTLGAPLPRLPLWLGTDICVPLDLEPTYLATCKGLRIPPGGLRLTR